MPHLWHPLLQIWPGTLHVVRADSGGEAFVDAATWDALQPKGRTQEEGRRAVLPGPVGQTRCRRRRWHR